MTIGEVDDGDDVRVDLLHCFSSGIDETDKVFHTLCGIGASCLVEHAELCFVAYRYPLRCDACILKSCEHVFGVVIDILFQCLSAVICPLCRYCLILRICPCVAVVETYHYLESLGMSSLAEGNDIVFAAPSSSRVYPYAETDCVDAEVVIQDVHEVGFLALSVVVVCAPAFLLTQPADVCTVCKGVKIAVMIVCQLCQCFVLCICY